MKKVFRTSGVKLLLSKPVWTAKKVYKDLGVSKSELTKAYKRAAAKGAETLTVETE